MPNQFVGGFTPYTTEISAAQKALLQKAVPELGMTYSAVAMATQETQGVNYRFFCNAEVVGPDVPNEARLVEFYMPLRSDTPENLKISIVPNEDEE